MTPTLTELMKLTDTYIAFLTDCGIEFDANGYPILDKTYYLKEIPSDLVPYHSRRSKYVHNKTKTALCFFCKDTQIYPRLKNVFNELDEYRQYIGVVACDITVTSNMDVEWQRELILLNQLFIAVLAVSGIKVIANLRCGSKDTLSALDAIPHGVLCATGTLGCGLIASSEDLSFIQKYLE